MKIPFGSYAIASGVIGGFTCALISMIITIVTNTLGYTNIPLISTNLFWYTAAGFFTGMITVYIVLKDITGRGVLRRKPQQRKYSEKFKV
jgi:hypothetical protein